MKNSISRRNFIKTSAIGAGGALLAGYGGYGCEKDQPIYTIPMFAMNALGAITYSSTMQDYSGKISKNSKQTAMVKNSGDRIKSATEKHMKDSGGSDKINSFAWEYQLIEDATVNAWCMPGARIAFYEGIMELCQDETGVAVVMGHEVAHAVSNHAGQRMGLQLLTQLGITALGEATKRILEPDEQVLQVAMSVFCIGAQYGVLLPYSRKNEYEADKMGLILMAKAGYDPREAPIFWERMEKQFGSGGSDFFSTHPSNANRIKELQNAIPEALEHYEG
jgi:Zn-dependent protease with chaperone function